MIVEYPLRSLIDSLEASQRSCAQEARAKKSRLESAWERDSDLSPLVRCDKYFLLLRQSVQERDFEQASRIADLLESSECKLDNNFHFLWGQSLMELGKSEAAATQFKLYLAEADSAEADYIPALKSLIELELHYL